MPNDIATLLERNLHGIFGESDEALRQKVAEEILHEDAVFVEPHGIYHGRDEIVRIAGVIRAMHPTFKYSAIAPAEVLHDQGGTGSVGRRPPWRGARLCRHGFHSRKRRADNRYLPVF